MEGLKRFGGKDCIARKSHFCNPGIDMREREIEKEVGNGREKGYIA